MKKKNYISPSMKICKLETAYSILAGSGTQGDASSIYFDEDELAPSQAL